jgi:hypothetical protein
MLTTTQILHVYKDSRYSGYITVYVTDYTPVRGGASVSAKWCPQDLQDKVLKVEMWDAALKTAEEMHEGEYWSLNNVKARQSGGGYLEAKIQEGKKQRKASTDDARDSLQLGALLKYVSASFQLFMGF